MNKKRVLIDINEQRLKAFEGEELFMDVLISSGKNGVGEKINSECTPRGWHQVHDIIGKDCEKNAVFVARKWTGEYYTEELFRNNPGRDWILTRIIQLDGLEPGRNKGGDVDSLNRFIYLHGSPDSCPMGIPGSRGCIRMRHDDIIRLADWIGKGDTVFING